MFFTCKSACIADILSVSESALMKANTVNVSYTPNFPGKKHTISTCVDQNLCAVQILAASDNLFSLIC